jgi:hypothetical protein
MCKDEARNVVIYSLNANIHVYVHEDLNEIYLYNVKIPGEKMSSYLLGIVHIKKSFP